MFWQKSHLRRLHLRLHSFSHYPRFMVIGEDRKKYGFKNWQLCSVWKLPFCAHRVIKFTQNCVCLTVPTFVGTRRTAGCQKSLRWVENAFTRGTNTCANQQIWKMRLCCGYHFSATNRKIYMASLVSSSPSVVHWTELKSQTLRKLLFLNVLGIGVGMIFPGRPKVLKFHFTTRN